MDKRIELVGTILGIIGAFIAAVGLGKYGYPIFTVSSICLLYSAFKQRNKNLVFLQSSFLAANCAGIMTFVFGG